MTELLEIVERKARTATRLAMSVACLKLELPADVFDDFIDALNEYLDAEGDFVKALDAKLAVVAQRVQRL